MLPVGHIIAERSVHIRDIDPGSGLPDADQPLRFVKGKRLEQDAIDDAENSRVRTDSQPQRDKRSQRKSRRSRETAKRILQVTNRIHHWAIPPAHHSAGPSSARSRMQRILLFWLFGNSRGSSRQKVSVAK